MAYWIVLRVNVMVEVEVLVMTVEAAPVGISSTVERASGERAGVIGYRESDASGSYLSGYWKTVTHMVSAIVMANRTRDPRADAMGWYLAMLSGTW